MQAQALGKLLENALQYTPEGGRINLQCRPLGNAPRAAAEIIVSDTGPGIPSHATEHVLERYVRLEDARHTPGNGLGLSLVKAVCNLHQAELKLQDASPGLQICIRLPDSS